ncbi:MAG: LptF/LptG family permease [Sulfuricurvum sp.]
MAKLHRYLISNLSLLFFSIFLPLFAIASIIFLIKLATYTYVIQLNIWEMGELYLFVLPELFFYTLPIAFIVSSALTLYRLSNDNELIVVFSLGVSPMKIARFLAKPAFILSALLFFDFFYVTPYIKIISGNFIDHKKSEAKFNLSASEFGHKFGDWMLFINKNDNIKHLFEDVVLFNKELKNEIVISAKSAELINIDGLLQLRLNDGESFSYDQNGLKQMIFKTAYINDMMSTKQQVYVNTIDYWTNDEYKDRKRQRLVTNTLFSLFPLLSIFMVMAVGVVHARHQKRWIYLWLFVAIIVYYSLSVVFYNLAGFHAIWLLALFWIAVTYGFYRKLVGERF